MGKLAERATLKDGITRQGEVSVLILEDDPFSCKLFKNILEAIRPDVDIHFAKTIAEAQNHLLRVPGIDLIVVDIFLSQELDGLDFYQWVCQRKQHAPVILTSGMSEERLLEILDGRKMEVPVFLHKPFHPQICAAIFAQVLK